MNRNDIRTLVISSDSLECNGSLGTLNAFELEMGLHKLDFNRCKTFAMKSNLMAKLGTFSTYSLLFGAYEPKHCEKKWVLHIKEMFKLLYNVCEGLHLSTEHIRKHFTRPANVPNGFICLALLCSDFELQMTQTQMSVDASTNWKYEKIYMQLLSFIWLEHTKHKVRTK